MKEEDIRDCVSHADRPVFDRDLSGNIKEPYPMACSYLAPKEVSVPGTVPAKTNMYSMRGLLLLMEYVQKEIRQVDVTGRDKSNNTVKTDDWGNVSVSIPLRRLMTGESFANGNRVMEGLAALTNCDLHFHLERSHLHVPVLMRAELDGRRGFATLTVHNLFWSVLNFSEGYIGYNISVAMSLTSRASLFFYKFIACTNSPHTLTLNAIKESLQLQDKYSNTKDLIRNVVKKAQSELDRKSPKSFRYTPVLKDNPHGGKKIISGIVVIPMNIRENETMDECRKSVHPKDILGAKIYDCLLYSFEFDAKGVRNHIKLLNFAMGIMSAPFLFGWLTELKPEISKRNDIRTVPGYVIYMLRLHLSNDFGVVFRKNAEGRDMDIRRSCGDIETYAFSFSDMPLETLQKTAENFIKCGQTPPAALVERIGRLTGDSDKKQDCR